MPIAGYNPTTPTQDIDTIKISDPPATSLVIDNDSIRFSTVQAYIEGMPWKVDYYCNIVRDNSELRELDVSQSGVYQQYRLIKDFELRVTTGLSPSYDAATGITTVTGSANVFGFITPNACDYFVARTGDMQVALFKIKAPERKHHSKYTIFSVDFEIVAYESQAPDLFRSLKAKTSQVYHYNKERHVGGLNPLVLPHEKQNIINLKKTYREMLEHYVKSFSNRVYTAFLLPGQDKSIVDVSLTQFMFRFVESEECPQLVNVTLYNTDDADVSTQSNIWDAIFAKSMCVMDYCNKYAGIVNRSNFLANPYLRGMRWSPIDYAVFAMKPDETAISKTQFAERSYAEKTYLDVGLNPTQNIQMTQYSYDDDAILINGKIYPCTKPIWVDDYYVFSEYFYNQKIPQTAIEALVLTHLQDNVVDIELLLELCRRYYGWPRMEQFYHGVVLMFLLKFYRINDIVGVGA